MAILTKQSSDVRFYENDLSGFITAASTGAVAQVLVSGKGPVDPTLFNSFEAYIKACGKPDARVSFDHYMAEQYFKEGNNLFVCRALGLGHRTSAVIVKADAAGNTLSNGISTGVPTPTSPDWGTLVGPAETPLFLVYPKYGPGSYGNRLAISIDSRNLSAPSSISGTTVPVTGFLPDGSYDYVVSALSILSTDSSGESVASIPNTFVLASSTSTNVINLTWTQVSGAVGYKVYRKLSSATTYDLVATVGSAITAFSDTGTAIPDNTKHPILSAAGLGATQTIFVLNIFDLDVAVSVPVESFEVSLEDQVDDSGAQLEIQARINAYSQYIRVKSRANVLSVIPGVRSIGKTQLTGGTSGSAPTASDINAAWEKFINKERYVVDVLMEWRPSTSVRKYVASLAERRNDAAAFLATPAEKQQANDAIDDRNIELNVNSSYAALFANDDIVQDVINGKILMIPPVGTAAAAYARTVRVAQPWNSIAGLNRGQKPNNLGIRVSYNEAEANNLVKANINYTRNMPGRGIALWEQFTLYNKESALQNLNVRFLLNTLKRSLYGYLLYFVQEMNDEILRRQISYGLNSFLEVVKAGRGVKDYRVVINDGNNPPAYAASGILGIAIYIVPTIAVREIRLTFVVGNEGITISEAEVGALALN